MVEELEEENNQPERDSGTTQQVMEEAMQQPTSLLEAQDERTVAQRDRGGAIEWQRTQWPGKRWQFNHHKHGLGGIYHYCLVSVYQ